MGCFDRLFGAGNGNGDSEKYSIDIRDDCFYINGKKLEVPIHINTLKAVLGEPRKKYFRTNKEDREFLEEYNKEQITKRVNYFWDGPGLMCYTNNGEVVNCFGIVFRHGDFDLSVQPKGLYKGVVTINGNPWFDVIKSGEDCEFYMEKRVGFYKLTAEYADFNQPADERTEESFNGIEIQLDNGRR